MAIFQSQFANVVEWQEFRDDVIFWKWGRQEIKKGSRLVIRPGQDAIFLYNGRIEGIFTDEGNYEIESQIIPFLSTLKGFKFGFNSGLRAEVVFVNVKEFQVKWGTKSPLLLPAPGLPGGMPVRAFGAFTMKVSDYVALIDKVAGIKDNFAVDDVKERVMAVLDQLLMRWISKEGRDMFNLQVNAAEIGEGIRQELDMEMHKLGLSILGFTVSNFNYPEEIQKKINQNASYAMVGDLEKYQRIAMTDAMQNGEGGGAMGQMMGAMMGMNMANQMISNSGGPTAATESNAAAPKFCSQCGARLGENAKFCSECGAKQ